MTAAHQLSLFEQRIPAKPYYTDDLSTGLRIRTAQQALKSRYIQHNGPTHKFWLVFDIDRAGATMDWYDRHAPAPNIIATNRENGHAHLIYGLEIAVRTAPDASSAALRYAAAIEHALQQKLGADASYSGLICKNPLHPFWQVSCWEQNLYTLDWLADYVDLSAYSSKKRLPDYGLGRNCNLFDSVRNWAYKAIRQGWPDYDRWLEAVETRAYAYNKRFSEPLPDNEIAHVAKSIARWTHRHMSSAGFSEWQANNGKRSGASRRKGTALEHDPKPWEALGISRATWYRRNKTA
jgi:hypothetical protein